MQKGICFLCPGVINSTLYYITEVKNNKCNALSIYISPSQVQGLEYPSEYDIDLPDNIIMMPSTTYDTIKGLMSDCVEEIHKTLRSEALVDTDFELESNHSYTDGEYIYKLTNLIDGRWHYKLFRVEIENISPIWSGDADPDGLKEIWRPITESTLQKVIERFKLLQDDIATVLGTKNTQQNIK